MSGLVTKIKDALTGGDHHETESKTHDSHASTTEGTTGSGTGAAGLSTEQSTHNKLHKSDDPRGHTGIDSSSTTGNTGAQGFVSERDQIASAALQGDHTHDQSSSHTHGHDTAATGTAATHNPSSTSQHGQGYTHEKENLGSAALVGAGAAGAAGVGAHEHSRHHDDSGANRSGATATSGPHASSGRHDPEVTAKESTSAAGNYPYWGDLKVGEHPGGQQHQTEGEHHLGRDAAIGSGALGAGAGATGAGGHLLHRDEANPSQGQGLTGQQTSSTVPSTTQSTPQTTGPFSSSTGPTSSTTTQPQQGESHTGRDAALGAGALGAGAGYLASRDNEKDRAGQQAQPHTSHAANAHVTEGNYGPQTTSGFLPDRTRQSDSPLTTGTPTTQHDGHHTARDAGLGAGAVGASGLASKEIHDHGSHGQTQQPPTAYEPTASTYGTPDTQQEHSGHSHDKALGAGAAGIAGTAGAAYYLANKDDDNNTANTDSSLPSSGGGIYNSVTGAGSSNAPSHRETQSGPNIPDSSPATTAGSQQTHQQSPYGQETAASGGLGAPSSGESRDHQGLATAAGVGAGAGLLGSGAQRHQQDEHSRALGQPSSTTDRSPATSGGYETAQYPSTGDANTGNQPSTTFSTQNDPKSGNYENSGFGNTAAGTAAGAAASAAWNKAHGNNQQQASQTSADRSATLPGSYPEDSTTAGLTESQPSHTTGSGISALPGTSGAATSGSSGYDGSKVVHKCSHCGNDEDITDHISNFFGKNKH